MKKKILILENAVHYHNVKVYEKIFKNKFLVTLYLAINEDKEFIKLDCPELLNRKKYNIINAWSHKIFFLKSIFLNKFDYYFVSYGPEQNKFYFLFNYIFYLIFSLIYNKKIIYRFGRCDLFFDKKKLKKLPFKDYNYKEENFVKGSIFTNIFRKIRIKAVENSGYLSFETKTIKENFKKYAEFKSKHLVIKPTHKNEIEIKRFKSRNRIILGLHGALDPRRRDYNLLLNELNKLNKKNKKKIIIKFLGSSNFISKRTIKKRRDKFQENLIKKFNSIGIKTISTNKGFITRKEYSKLIENVEFLLDIQKKDGHFFTKPTGLITDAQNFSKRILMNIENDPLKEYKKMSVYYNNLSSGINKILDKKFKMNKVKIKLNNVSEINKIGN